MESISNIFLILSGALKQFTIRDAIDILIVTIVIYKLLMATKETRAIQVFKGIGVILVGSIVADYLKLASVQWILNTLLQSGVVFVIILFQPELRKALEGIGRGSVFKSTETKSDTEKIISEITTALFELSKRKVGALIVMQINSSLTDIINTGTKINSDISAPLIENIFEPNTPLHDGAMIVSQGRIVAAGCFLPLSDNFSISKELGTRHRAGLGISEVSDSITFIVSEETGVISYTRNGKLIRYLDKKTINDLLIEIYGTEEERSRISSFIRRVRNENKL